MAGGKGKKSTSAKTDSLLYTSRMVAKVDSAAVQDGYSLYHHVILFYARDDWAVVQQGMNVGSRMARRYHWFSGGIQNFVREHGALEFREAVGDDLNVRWGVPIPRMIKLKRGGMLFFSWFVFKSRVHRDRFTAKVMKDPRLAKMDPESMPFDVNRPS